MISGRNNNRPLVVVVDDDPDMVLVIEEFLDLCGYDSAIAGDADEFLPLMEREPVAVLLDLVMPDDSARRIIDMLAEKKSSVPVVMISSLSLAEINAHRDAAIKKGVSAPTYMRKPFWVNDLLGALRIAVSPDIGSGLVLS